MSKQDPLVSDIKKSKKVAIFHSQYGNEKLIENIVSALESKNYEIKLFMPNVNENKDLPKNHFSGSYIPTSVFGHFQILFDIVRLIICAVMVACDCSNEYEYIIYDGSCLIIPILRLKCNKILYYCSDPKKMARPVKTNILKKCFRLAINLLRELTAGMASTIIVNSTYS